MLDHFKRFARYNAWANQRLYSACSVLPRDTYLQPRPSFFGSLHRTLNHILVGDRIWMGRFVGVPSGISALDQVLYPELDSLRAARDDEDVRIRAYIDSLDEPTLAAPLAYATMAGVAFEDPLAALLAHLFNHQTHHRGQAHGLLSEAGATPPPLDLLYFMRDEARTT